MTPSRGGPRNEKDDGLNSNRVTPGLPERRTIGAYDAGASEFSDRYEAADRASMQRTMLSLFHQGNRILELGCGSGADAAALVHHGVEVVAVDGSEGMLAEAVHRHPELKGRLQHVVLPGRLPFNDQSFDGVLAAAILMHLSTQGAREVIKEIARVVKPGGRVYVSLVGRGAKCESWEQNGRFFSGASLSDLETVFHSAGLDLEQSNRVQDALGRAGVEVEVGIFARLRKNVPSSQRENS